MEILGWRARKKLFFFSIVVAFFGGIAVLFVLYYWPQATCLDGKQNQLEEGVDCGGPCTPCVTNPKDIITLWSRVFKIGSGLYEAASLVDNPNLFYGMPLFKYTFKLYDSNNTLVGAKEGQSFLNPKDKFVIFVTGINTNEREAVKTVMELEYLASWQYINKDVTPPVVSKKNFTNTPFPTLGASLSNESLFPMENIYASAVLYDKSGNAMAVSSTKVELIPKESSRGIFFTWPESFAELPASSEIFIRTDLNER